MRLETCCIIFLLRTIAGLPGEDALKPDYLHPNGIVYETLIDSPEGPCIVRNVVARNTNDGASVRCINGKQLNKDYDFILTSLRVSIEQIFEDGIKSFKKTIVDKRKEVLKEKNFKFKHDGYEYELETGYLGVGIKNYWKLAENPFHGSETMHYPSHFKDFLEKNSLLLTKETPERFLRCFGRFFDGYMHKYIKWRVNNPEDIVNFNSDVRNSVKSKLIDNICYRLSIGEHVGKLCSGMESQKDQKTGAKLTWENCIDETQKLMDETLKSAYSHIDDSQDEEAN
ncbi:uncharacterized protein VICG_02063 [Vittaforma corneae ATCC 50505]|uniref:Uncharacterized protein n=1 Tax=Vittaforma corneae (strain ATCC 50505) TaxID=993615 RepID=L2GJ66_VITCO|nr:uncharacterized protein VICG_02063 [Vittaforma corneae ATCC 50505]ELA40923.1 hypothetical protein VICG_02063 [Vittaforma corneae ATCC 50505]